jgi:hypothetical protein
MVHWDNGDSPAPHFNVEPPCRDLGETFDGAAGIPRQELVGGLLTEGNDNGRIEQLKLEFQPAAVALDLVVGGADVACALLASARKVVREIRVIRVLPLTTREDRVPKLRQEAIQLTSSAAQRRLLAGRKAIGKAGQPLSVPPESLTKQEYARVKRLGDDLSHNEIGVEWRVGGVDLPVESFETVAVGHFVASSSFNAVARGSPAARGVAGVASAANHHSTRGSRSLSRSGRWMDRK